MKFLKSQVGAIGVGTVITLVGSFLAAGAWVVTYVDAQVSPIQVQESLIMRQHEVLGANLFYICEAVHTHCEPIPTQ